MDILDRIHENDILVIGDVMVDTYYMGEVKRISPEAPVPVLKKQNERNVLGGAANVSANLVSAGQNAYMMTVIGHDRTADKMLTLLKNAKVNSSLILMEQERTTTEKVRILGQNNQQIMRVDIEETNNITSTQAQHLLHALERKIDKFGVIVLSDYLKGVLSYEFTQGVIELGKKYNKKVIIDVKDPKIEKYKGAYLLKPNLLEVRNLTNMPAKTDSEIIEASIQLCNMCYCQYVLTTCGERGMVLVNRYGEYQKIECYSREVYDVTGAGDTVIAYLAMGIANNLEIGEAVKIANVAAGVKVSKVGTSAVSLEEVKQYRKEEIKRTLGSKIIEGEEIREIRKIYKDQKIVFTNGCFDILHAGHIRYLHRASELGDILIVGINTDQSVSRLKGPERPINTLDDRMEVLEALEFVDYVIAFDEDTPLELIKKIKPDVLVKGADYAPEDVVGREFVEARGGRLELIQYVAGKSTTNIISKIKN